MGLILFFVGAIFGALLLIILPIVIALLGVVLAVGLFVALPLIFAILILVGVIAAAPAFAYGLLLATVLVLLWANERRKPRRLPPP